MSLTGTLGIGKSALLSHQQSIATISHNIANANTKGYHKQSAVLKAGPPMMPGASGVSGYSVGTGVTVADIARAYSRLQEMLFLGEVSNSEYHSGKADSLKRIEALLAGSTDTSLAVRFREFWNSWQNLAHSPDSMAFRTELLGKADSLAAYIRTTYNNLSDYRNQISEDLGGGAFGGMVQAEVGDINNIATQIQDINRIMTRMPVSNVNDLLDRRDQLIRELAERANIEVAIDFSILIDSQLLVSADGQVRNELEQDGNDPITFVMVDENGDPLEDEFGDPLGPASITGGTLGAWVELAGEVDGLLDQLDDLAAALITDVNELHINDGANTAYDLDGNGGGAFFVAGGNASNISTAITDPSLIAAAATRYDDTPTPNTGDGAKALEIAQLGFKKEPGRLNEMTFEDYFTSMLVTLGVKIQTANARATDSAYIVNMMSDEIQRETGVSVDEEMIEMISAQRAYQAAARIISVVDDMLDLIINRM